MSRRVLRAAIVLLAGFAPIWAAPSGTDTTAPEGVPEEVVSLVAEGYGSASRGGAGGREIWVTNLNDHGRGSLRTALMNSRRRIIRFRVGGTIKLEKRLVVTSGRVTVDGLSAAPHGGITIEGGLGFKGCEDVIVRHVRLRGGYDPLGIYYSRHVLIDHVSAAWATDENIDVWDSQDVTLQWCLVAEAMAEGGHEKGAHSMGSLQSGGSRRVTTHHCLFTGNFDRNPLLSGPRPDDFRPQAVYSFDVINNVIYNYWHGAKVSRGAEVNFIGNTFRAGPDSGVGKAEILINPVPGGPTGVFVRDNRGPHRESDTSDEDALVLVYSENNREGEPRWGAFDAQAERYISAEPFPAPGHAVVQAQPREEAYDLVLARVGTWPRDAEDTRLVTEVTEGTGMIGRVGPRWREIYGVAPAAGWEKLDEEETAEDEEADHALPPPDAL
jgi:pectate lyase